MWIVIAAGMSPRTWAVRSWHRVHHLQLVDLYLPTSLASRGEEDRTPRPSPGSCKKNEVEPAATSSFVKEVAAGDSWA
jgi:hypothetical protein